MHRVLAAAELARRRAQLVRGRAQWAAARARRECRRSERLRTMIRLQYPRLGDVEPLVPLAELDRILDDRGPPTLRIVPSSDEH